MNRRLPLLYSLGLAAACLAIYGQTASFGFVNYDDDAYVSHNGMVSGGLTWAGVVWAFRSFDFFYFHPLTWLSLMLDATLWGPDPGAMHLTNAALHAVNSILLFVVLRRMAGDVGGARSALAAALFAVHPMRVESVVWITERKDMLSGLFWFLTLLAYTWYAESPTRRRYLAVTGCFLLGLLAKPAVVTLPAILLLADWWPLARWRERPWRALVFEKLPLALLSAAFAVLTAVGASRSGATGLLAGLPIATRLGNAIVSYVRYLGKLVWPESLAVFYPYNRDLSPWQVAGSGALLASITALCVWQARRRPYLLAGWLWFLVALLPNIGLIQAGAQAYANRFTYLAYTGLFVAGVWAAADWRPVRRRAGALAAAVLCLFAWRAWAEASYWRDSVTLFTRATQVTEGNAVAHQHLGDALADLRRSGEAAPHYREALRLDPTLFNVHYRLGRIAFEQGRFAEAEASFAASVRLRPDYSLARQSLGMTLIQLGREAEAVPHLEAALAGVIAPQDALHARQTLATIHARAGRARQAVAELEAALKIEPNSAEAHNNLGILLAEQGDTAAAIHHFRESVRLRPSYEPARRNLEAALAGASGTPAR